MRRATLTFSEPVTTLDGQRTTTVEVGRAHTRVGRSKALEISVSSNRLSREHFVLTRRGTSVTAFDLDSTYGTWVLGADGQQRRLRQAGALQDGDRVDLNLRALFSMAPGGDDAQEQTLLSVVAREPDDPSAWHVYADFLLEQGDPRGQRIREATLGGELPQGLEGHATLEWAHGHVRRLTLAPSFAEVNRAVLLSWVLLAPATEFVQELQLGRAGTVWHPDDRGLAALALLPALKRLSAPRNLLDAVPPRPGLSLELAR